MEEGRGTATVQVTRLGSEEVRKDFSSIIDRAWEGERFVVSRFDRDRVVILGLREYERLTAAPERGAG